MNLVIFYVFYLYPNHFPEPRPQRNAQAVTTNMIIAAIKPFIAVSYSWLIYPVGLPEAKLFRPAYLGPVVFKAETKPRVLAFPLAVLPASSGAS